jgi:hypothetical protein
MEITNIYEVNPIYIVMDYSGYMSELLTYKRIEKIEDTDKSFLFKIMNSNPSTSKITSYLKLRRHPKVDTSEYIVAKRLKDINFIEETHEGKSLHEADNCKLTSHGLLYILSSITNYPPKLLIKYKDSIILQTLLYPYFEPDTIKNCTARLYYIITQYLRECCETTFKAIDVIRDISNREENEIYTKQLEIDLQWHAKFLGFKIVIFYNESNILTANPDTVNDGAKVALYEVETSMKTVLSEDNKFIKLIDIVQKEFEDGFSEILKSRSS